MLNEFYLVLLLTAAVVNIVDCDQKPFKVVCCVDSQSNYREEDGRFVIEDINPFLCTHVIYEYAKLDSDYKISSLDPTLDLKEEGYKRFNNLKNQNPDLHTLIGIGGEKQDGKPFSKMASSNSSRAVFINSVVDFCLKYKFDGLSLDWFHPGNNRGAPEDKQNFVLLLEELKEALEPCGLLLAAAVSSKLFKIEPAYDIYNVGKYVDFLMVWTFHYHSYTENATGHNTPLYARPEEQGNSQLLNVNYSINYWINNGAPREKLVMAVAAFGRSFTLVSADNNDIGAPTAGPGVTGPWTKNPGTTGFNEICKLLRNDDWTIQFADYVEAPYAYKDNQWIGYDETESIAIKADYIKKMGLSGGMVWSLDTDDFRRNCYNHKYPLLTALYNVLNGPVTV